MSHNFGYLMILLSNMWPAFFFFQNRLKARSYAASEHLRLVSKIMFLFTMMGQRPDEQYSQLGPHSLVKARWNTFQVA